MGSASTSRMGYNTIRGYDTYRILIGYDTYRL